MLLNQVTEPSFIQIPYPLFFNFSSPQLRSSRLCRLQRSKILTKKLGLPKDGEAPVLDNWDV